MRVYTIYRKTTGENDDISIQQSACRAYAAKQGWEIGREFYEQPASDGKFYMSIRDGLRVIRDDARLNKFDVLLVFSIDCIGREKDETPFVVQYLINSGISVYSVYEGTQHLESHISKIVDLLSTYKQTHNLCFTGNH